MSEKKKQHYVPRFYLKLFSINGNGTHLRIYQKLTARFIQKGRLKNQAQENFFYGQDLFLEDWFGEIEGKTASVIQEIACSQELPKRNTEPFQFFFLFTLLQAFRTKAQAEELNELTDSLMKTIMKYEKKFEEYDFDSFKIGYKDAPVQNIKILLENLQITADLEVKLISNSTGIPFITSDNPVFKYNQFLESKNFPGGRNGMGSKGLQIFFPISPESLVIIYDPKVYKVGGRKRLSKIEAKLEDIEAINLLIFLNASETLFADENVNSYFFEKLADKGKKFEKKAKIEVNEYTEYKKEEGSNDHSILVHQKKINIETKMNLSFIKYTPHAKYYKLNGTMAELRELATYFRKDRR